MNNKYFEIKCVEKEIDSNLIIFEFEEIFNEKPKVWFSINSMSYWPSVKENGDRIKIDINDINKKIFSISLSKNYYKKLKKFEICYFAFINKDSSNLKKINL